MSHWKRRERLLSDDYVAGNGLLNRRVLLGRGLAVVGAAGAVTGAAAEPLKDAAMSTPSAAVAGAVVAVRRLAERWPLGLA